MAPFGIKSTLDYRPKKWKVYLIIWTRFEKKSTFVGEGGGVLNICQSFYNQNQTKLLVNQVTKMLDIRILRETNRLSKEKGGLEHL